MSFSLTYSYHMEIYLLDHFGDSLWALSGFPNYLFITEEVVAKFFGGSFKHLIMLAVT